MGVNTTPLDMRDRGYFQTPDSTADRPKADNGFYVTFCDGVEVLKAIRERLVDARRQAALDFENDTTEAAYVFYQRHIDAADRAIADSFKPASKTVNEGRGLFPRNQEFGDWKQKNVFSQLGITQPKADDDVAAMWAAANQDDFDTARAAGNARTVRGIHAKWLVTYNLQVTGGDAANIRTIKLRVRNPFPKFCV